MKNKKSNTILIIQGVLFIILIIGATYAYLGIFNINLNNNVAVNINSTSPGNLSFIANSTQLNLQVPDTSMTKYNANNTVAAKEDTGFVDITLTGAEGFLTTCSYDLVYEYNTNSDIYGITVPVTTGATKEITIEVNGMNGNNHFATETNFNFDTSKGWSNATSSTGAKVTLVTGATLKSLGTQQSVRWKVTGRYYNLDLNQYALSGKSFTGKIYVENVNCSTEDGSSVKKGYETILANNGGKTAIEAKTADFTTIETSNAGMYSYTEGTGKTYYYRGAVDNNWVKYGKFKEDQIVYRGYFDENSTDEVWYDGNSSPKYIDYPTLAECQTGVDYDSTYNYKCKAVTYAHKGDDMYWRIIRVDKDNKIKMIYAGSKAPSESTKVAITGANTNMGFTAYNNDYNHAEYVGFQYTVGSQRGTTTNSTIKTYLDNWYTKYFNENIGTSRFVKTTFCNDRNTSSTWASNGSRVEYAPYTRLSADTPTPTFECNAADVVTNNFGLITADEIVLAGGKLEMDNSAFYLNNNMVYWAGSPYGFYASSSHVFVLNPIYGLNYGLNYGRVSARALGARGVVSLSSESKLLGSGTYNDVYTVN
ncbi:MAG: hypothetical protein PUH53_02015 [Mycoplasma sp.]|nr:hypothetical protein [Mycoplasma sp.]